MTDLHAISRAPMVTGGVLGVFAHPDDETLGAGGLLASAASAGVGVGVVTATRGELGEVLPPDIATLADDRPALAHEREHELSRALAALGVRAHRFLDTEPGLAERRPPRFTDSGMGWVRPGLAGPGTEAGPDALVAVPVEVAARLLAAVVRRARPQVVLTEEPHGSYGHPDHIQVHQITMRAVELAADAAPRDEADDPLTGTEPWDVPVVGWIVEPEDRFRAALRWLETMVDRRPQFGVRGDALGTISPDRELPSLVVPPDQVDLTIDVKAVLPAVITAMKAHRSQVQAVHLLDLTLQENRGLPVCGWFAVSNGLLQPLLGTASLRLAPGRDRVDELSDPRTVDGLTRDRLAGTRGTDRLAAFLGGTVA
ncbi:N-acetyl-1-D-myo-inositol-2-amino-2-deoxy-alpha-D-glucopyranoside deacetylase [Georgenia soli]|uniref:N-acetyl-1-D-myo-inositol-2-amino-2-deoxy-alpha-D-glucopyranoside deacetylase n=1 Tax=Georgenia soli TaxID=638953 RepID=A0A2A9EJH3_9MICO|nr:PIG-L family deacetylase [Georgenia soli]PFG38756.1 N-acetyl-1-D-myo-inositol-2-amino-2-deoxy-alpha-D-glucopyranoside deacetylase [Georgenia soli]